jgi:hypothetical protein
MTILLPLPHPTAGPSRPPSYPPSSTSFAEVPDDVHAELCGLVKQVKSARRIVVVCGESESARSGAARAARCGAVCRNRESVVDRRSGAGISTAADIPDFRSAAGLFGSGSGSAPARVEGKGKGRAKAPETRDLFHVKCLAVSIMTRGKHS